MIYNNEFYPNLQACIDRVLIDKKGFYLIEDLDRKTVFMANKLENGFYSISYSSGYYNEVKPLIAHFWNINKRRFILLKNELIDRID